MAYGPLLGDGRMFGPSRRCRQLRFWEAGDPQARQPIEAVYAYLRTIPSIRTRVPEPGALGTAGAKSN